MTTIMAGATLKLIKYYSDEGLGRDQISFKYVDLAPKEKQQQALRQKDRLWTKLRKAIKLAPKKQFSFIEKNLSGNTTETRLVLGASPNFLKARVDMEKKTPLYDCHVELGAKMVSFAGYLMPVQYNDIIEEHNAVRTKLGIFDVSHMGEVIISGSDALKNINYLFTNDFTSMTDGRVRYSPMCNYEGGVIDDLLIYRINQDKYLVVVNASNREKDVEWMKNHIFGQVSLEDASDSIAQIAIQGPKARQVLAKLTDEASIPEKYYTFVESGKVAGVECLVSQTGYTGEHGYELYCDTKDAEILWKALLQSGKEEGILPCGLGARDTLRLEAAMPLYGHEMDDTVSPLETGLDFGVKLQKDDFIGKSALIAKGEPKITRVGLKVTGRGIIREHCSVFIGEEKIGETTSGTFLPFLNGAYAMALVEKNYSAVGTAVSVDVRGRRVEAVIVPLPFYKKS